MPNDSQWKHQDGNIGGSIDNSGDVEQHGQIDAMSWCVLFPDFAPDVVSVSGMTRIIKGLTYLGVHSKILTKVMAV